jgi:hypothetical protein
VGIPFLVILLISILFLYYSQKIESEKVKAESEKVKAEIEQARLLQIVESDSIKKDYLKLQRSSLFQKDSFLTIVKNGNEELLKSKNLQLSEIGRLRDKELFNDRRINQLTSDIKRLKGDSVEWLKKFTYLESFRDTVTLQKRTIATQQQSNQSLQSQIRSLQSKSNESEQFEFVASRLVSNYFNYPKFDSLYNKDEQSELFKILNLGKNRPTPLLSTPIIVYHGAKSTDFDAFKTKIESLGLKINYSTDEKRFSAVSPNAILYFSDADFIKAFLLKEQLLPLKLQIRDGRGLKTSLNTKDIAVIL